MQLSKTLFPIFLFLLIICTACGGGRTQSSSKPDTQSSSKPNRLQVTGKDSTWTIIDAQKVQQIFAEEHKLPIYHFNGGGVGPACTTYYTLKFLAGSNLVEQDTVETGGCSYIRFSDGSVHAITQHFRSQLDTLKQPF